jgi:outer membrane biosynthesis protein TonB
MFEIFKKLGRKPAEKKGEEKKAKAPKAKKAKSTKKKASPKKAVANPVATAQKALGLPETGVMDYTTQSKIQKFQMLNDLPLTGEADEETLKKLG